MQASWKCGILTASIDDGAEATVVVCHCLDCQKRSGSPFGAMAYFPEGAVAFAGDAREFSRATDGGNVFTTGFCPNCGSTVYGRPSGFPGIVGVTVGTIDAAVLPPPARSVFEESRHAWVVMPDETDCFVRGRDGARVR